MTTQSNGGSTKNTVITAAEQALAAAQSEVEAAAKARDDLAAQDLNERDHGALAAARDRLRSACQRRDQRRVALDRQRLFGQEVNADIGKFQKFRAEAAGLHAILLGAIDRLRNARDRVGSLRNEIADLEFKNKYHDSGDYAGYSSYVWGLQEPLPDYRRRLAELRLELESAEVELADANAHHEEAATAWGRVKQLVNACEAALRELPGGNKLLQELPDPVIGATWKRRTRAEDATNIYPRDPRPTTNNSARN